ncbi:hypothetical protein [Streptomyces vastus]|uniref:Uncharacterized protein n=1 Tax=Streptomyces vastus TaxID=285451 RepID=A0ABP6CNA6_9ACTN
MANCCGAARCTCRVTAGPGITVEGNGSAGAPYVISGGGGTTALQAADTPTVDATVTGTGAAGDPYEVSAAVILDPAPPGGGTNLLEAGPDGLYVECADVRTCFSAGDGATYDQTTGEISARLSAASAGASSSACASCGPTSRSAWRTRRAGARSRRAPPRRSPWRDPRTSTSAWSTATSLRPACGTRSVSLRSGTTSSANTRPPERCSWSARARFTGSLSLRCEHLLAGDVVQVRMSEWEGANLKRVHPIHEVMGTAGGTYAVVPLVKRLGPGRSMRVRLLNQSAGGIEVASAVLKALVWKES